MPQRVRAYFSVQTRTLASCQDDIFVKDVADSRTRQSFMARIVKNGLVELFGAIQLVFLQVSAENLNRVSTQRYGTHIAPLSQNAQLRAWTQAHGSDGKCDLLLNTP